jgi:hypothetical protein
MMDHAAAHEELADLALEPRRLRRIAHDAGPVAASLRAHVDACPGCRAELEAWQAVYRALDVATADGAAPLASSEAAEAPTPSLELRGRLLAAIAVSPSPAAASAAVSAAAAPLEGGARATPTGGVVGSTGRSGSSVGRRPTLGRVGRLGWLAAAAALIVALGAGALVAVRTGEVDRARLQTAELGTAAAALDRILAAPTHWVATLRAADGSPGGTLAWSPSEVVVLATALRAPDPGVSYRCWIERDGYRTPIGEMDFAGGVGYWAGTTSGWGDLAPGSRFGVTAVDAMGGTGPALLVADL